MFAELEIETKRYVSGKWRDNFCIIGGEVRMRVRSLEEERSIAFVLKVIKSEKKIMWKNLIFNLRKHDE